MDVSHGRGCVLLSDHSLWCFETRVAVASVEATAVDAFVYGTDELCFTQGTNIVCKPREGVHRTLPR